MRRIEEIHLAQLANGGTRFEPAFCFCDHSVNSKCRYCAIHHGLAAGINEITGLESQLSTVQGQIIYKDEQHSMTVAAHDESLVLAFEMGADWALCGFRSKDGLAEAEARRLLSQNLLGKP